MLHRICYIQISAIPQRDLDPAFEYMDELRTMTEMQEVIADRHRVKMNSLMGMHLGSFRERPIF